MSCLSLLASVVLLLQTPAAAPAPPKFALTMLAAHETLAPGGQTELLLQFDVQDGYHVYDPIILDTGAPTTVSFQAPPGLTFGPLRFPEPAFAEEAGLKYLAHSGRFAVLTTLDVAADVPAGPLTIVADARALCCMKQCVPVEAHATLKLNVAPGTPTPANAEAFETAHGSTPPPFAKASFLEGSSVRISRDPLTPGEVAELLFNFKVRAGHHIQDRDPRNENLIASRLYVEPVDGLAFGEQVWPEPHIAFSPGSGKVREQNGDVTIRVPVRIVDEKFLSGPAALRVLLTYQCCVDKGSCFLPTATADVVRFDIRTPSAALPAGAVHGTTVPRVRPPAAGGRRAVEWSVLWTNIMFAFLGGLLLNVMPCVFPVISIKILGFVKQAGESRSRVFFLGLSFCAGIMVWFWLFAVLTSGGLTVWQSTTFMIGLTAFLFLFALNLFGVFEIILPGAAANQLDELSGREGYFGSFLKGLLATLMGTACTAPFFATAAAYAATQPPIVGYAVFTSAGVGMSFPYLLLCSFPGWLKLLPKPGAWMVTFKQAAGFVLVGTVIWLLTIVAAHLDASGVVWTVCFLSFLSFAAWLIGKIGLNWSTSSRLITWMIAIVTVLVGWWFCFQFMYDLNAPARAAGHGAATTQAAARTPEEVVAAARAADWHTVPWQPYAPGLAEELSRQGYTVYVDYTATWCVTCQTNKKTAVDVESTRAKMVALGVIPLEADYTKPNPDIRADLLRFEHNSVPLNLIYPAGRPEDVIHLPVLLTPGIVQEALDRAGPSKDVAPASAPADGSTPATASAPAPDSAPATASAPAPEAERSAP